MLPIRQEAVQRRGIGKGRIFADRRVGVLLFSVGAEGRSIEGDQRRAGGLGIPNILDGRVYKLGDSFLPGDEAGLGFSFDAFFISVLPDLPDQRVVLRKDTTAEEAQVFPGEQVLPMGGKGRDCIRCFRIPGGEKRRDRFRRRAVRVGEQFEVQGFCRCKTLLRPFCFSLVVQPQEIRGVVPQEVRQHTGGAFHRSRQFHLQRQHPLPVLAGMAEGKHIQKPAGSVDLQRPGYFHCCPAGAGKLSLRGQFLIIIHQSLKDHRNTSQSRRSSTPRCSSARKNWGRMFSGSE